MNRFLIALGIITVWIGFWGFYRMGHKDGCYDTINAENEFGINDAHKGIGLSAWAWCQKQ